SAAKSSPGKAPSERRRLRRSCLARACLERRPSAKLVPKRRQRRRHRRGVARPDEFGRSCTVSAASSAVASLRLSWPQLRVFQQRRRLISSERSGWLHVNVAANTISAGLLGPIEKSIGRLVEVCRRAGGSRLCDAQTRGDANILTF